MRTAIVNLGRILSGDWRKPFVQGDAILMEGGLIVEAGKVADSELTSCDVVIDAGGAVSKATLWARHCESLSSKCLVEVCSISMNRVTFRHDNDN